MILRRQLIAGDAHYLIFSDFASSQLAYPLDQQLFTLA